jgi:CheY-like chemotaxis protein
VVLDFKMPQLNGYETLKFIKQLSPNAKVIGLTAVKFDSLPKEYVKGVDTLLSKPIDAATLNSVVDELLGDRQATSTAIQS